jgi:hypothetical protein
MSKEKKTSFRINHQIAGDPIEQPRSDLGMFDEDNPDLELFNLVDDEMIRLSGSEVLLYRYHQDGGYDSLYDEDRRKAVEDTPVMLIGHYDPRAIEENLGEFGLELTNDQMFTFNKHYVEKKIGRALIPGDILKPKFQNIRYEVFEVQEDSFEAYGVYHLVASAKVLRDHKDVQREDLR